MSSPLVQEATSQKTLTVESNNNPHDDSHLSTNQQGVSHQNSVNNGSNSSQSPSEKDENEARDGKIPEKKKVFKERTYKLLVKGVFETMLCPREILRTYGSSLVPPDFLEKSGKKRKKNARSGHDDETWDPSKYFKRGGVNTRTRKRAKWIDPTQNFRDQVIVGTRKWVACDKCEKWRQIPVTVSDFELRGIWYCSMNRWNPHKAFCEAPEDTEDEPFPAPGPVNGLSQPVVSQWGGWTPVSNRLEEKEKGGWTTVADPISKTKPEADSGTALDQSRLMATLSQQVQAQQRAQFYAHLHKFLQWLKHPNPRVALEQWVDVQGFKVELYVLYLSCLRWGGYKACSSNGNSGFNNIALEIGLQPSAGGEEPKDALAKLYFDVLFRYEEQFSPLAGGH